MRISDWSSDVCSSDLTSSAPPYLAAAHRPRTESNHNTMDEQVIAAMARWPDVPDVYGWLSLSERGEWRLHPQGDALRPQHCAPGACCSPGEAISSTPIDRKSTRLNSSH